jgi:hypothetical protein
MPLDHRAPHVTSYEEFMTASRRSEGRTIASTWAATAQRPARLRLAGMVALFAAGTLVAACGTSTTEVGRGTLAVQLTDAPFPTDSVQRVDIYVVRVDARLADADSATAAKGATDDSANTGGWTTITRPNQVVNLLAYQNGTVLPIGNANITAGNYAGFRLVIDPTKSSVTLKNGAVLSGTSTPSILFPSGSRSGIKIAFPAAVHIAANDTTTVLVDFIVANSFVMRGNSISQNGLSFKPVIQGTVRP